MLSKIPLYCLHVAVKTESNFMRVAEITSRCRKTGRELLLFCARGCFSGLGVGLFLFLRLGAPATRELSGYVVGLFLMAGLNFGFSLWVIRSLVFPLIHHFRHSNSPTSRP
jgi:hypothetical protein